MSMMNVLNVNVKKVKGLNVKVMDEVAKEVVNNTVKECGRLYNFDAEEAMRKLNIESSSVTLISNKNVKKEKKEKSMLLPFTNVKDDKCCSGILKNHGLYTQCESSRKEGEKYCKSCKKQAEKNESGKPDGGDVDDRLSVGLYEYRDVKGKCPVKFTKLMKKLNLTKEAVVEEACRLNKSIPEVHFEEEEVKRGRPKGEKVEKKESTGKKGRPKKSKKVLDVGNDEEEDLFAMLVANANASENVVVTPETAVEAPVEVAVPVPVEVAVPVKEKKAKKVKEVDPAKEAEKQKKTDEKAAKDAEKEAEKQKKADEKAAKEAEKQKKADEKAAKEAEKELEKQKKADEKAAKEVEKQKKADEKAAKGSVKQKKSPKESSPSSEEEADVVNKIEYEGKSYYKSKKNGIIYNLDQEVIGKWNSQTEKIDFEDEEEEEEYDE
jgi:hypothetical protein